jgi:hypothetical protein
MIDLPVRLAKQVSVAMAELSAIVRRLSNLEISPRDNFYEWLRAQRLPTSMMSDNARP